MYTQQWFPFAVLSGHKLFHTSVNNNNDLVIQHRTASVAALYFTVISGGLTVSTVSGTSLVVA
jgi:hypothetical protein